MWPNLKQQVWAVLPKPKLIVYIGRSKKIFEPDPSPKKSLFTFQFSIPIFQILNFQILKFQIPNFQIANIQIANFQISNFQIPNFQIPKFQIANFRF